MARKKKKSLKKHPNLEQLQAMESLYGSTLTVGRLVQQGFVYVFIVSLFSIILYMNVWITVAYALLTAFYVYWVITPYEVRQRYEERSMAQRNRFLNLVTQGMANKNALALNVLRTVVPKVDGEFHDDLETLLAILSSTNEPSDIHQAFLNISSKYHDDFYFGLFMEHFETAILENIYNMETFRVFKTSHDAIMLKQTDFRRQKRLARRNVLVILLMLMIATGILCFVNGFKKYVDWFAHALVGHISSTLFMLLVFIIMHKFFKLFYDDVVTSL